jgi:translocation and assembly module TamA
MAIITSCFLPIANAAQEALSIKVQTADELPIKKSLVELTKEIEETAKVYQTGNQIAYWENEAKKLFYKLLHAQGYYSSSIDVEINSKEANSIIFHINSWQRYTLDKVTIKHAPKSNKDIMILDVNSFKLKSGQFAIAEDILIAQQNLLKYIENNNCLLSLNISHEATINHIDNKVAITFIVDAGPTATVENVTFTGLKTVNTDYARKLVGLQDGQCFKTSYITKSRGLLQKSGLFASTTPTIPKTTNAVGSVPIIFNLTERKPRSLKAGAVYGTDLGLGAKLGWEHRNLFGSGEKIDTSLFGNKKEQIFNVDYTEPFYKRDDQTLKLALTFENQKSKAFDSKEGTVSGFLERDFSDKWTGGFGGKLAQAKIKKAGDGKGHHFLLLSTPIFVTNDTRNNVLDPKKGHELRLEAAPFFSLHSKEKPFFKTQISGSTYFIVPIKSKPVVAVRAATGSILGIQTARIPHTERFFVGGSNSLRGYAYQLAGDLDAQKRPTGGRSFLETTVELRLRLTDTIGMVGFLDSGFAYKSLTPRRDQKLLHGAGFGLRYITDFGPIRADIGFPLKRRKFIDNAFQLYFGIGQTF